ncbi:MAG: hypothetical protein R3A78_16940 [Polyangiales bacterium]|nr:hypothetical protein [Myxococcales bacterium]
MKTRSIACLFLALAGALAGCDDSSSTKKPNDLGLCDPDDATGSNSRFLVISALDTIKEDKDGNLEGFNLDGTAKQTCECTTSEDENGNQVSNCGDYTSAEGTTGIDNQFSRLDQEVGEVLNLSGEIKKNIGEGDLIVLVSIDGLDDKTITSTTNDDCVAVEIYLGYVPNGGPPELKDGELVAGQTFDIRDTSFTDGMAMVRVGGAIENGRLIAGGADIPLSLPVGSATIDFVIRGGRFDAKFDGDSLKGGLIGGFIDVEELIDSVESIEAYASLGAILRPVLNKFADMNPGADKKCTAVSAALTFDAISAVRGDVGTRPDYDAGDSDAGDSDAGVDGG